MKMKKMILMLGIFGLAMIAQAEEKVVWCPKDGIGKNQTWKTKAEAEVVENELRIKLNGTEWSGVGINWEGYWPADAGVKVSDYKYLLVTLKVSGKGSGALQLALKDNKHKVSDNASVKKYCEEGKQPVEFTTLKIPIADFLGEKSKFESGVAWELMIHIWTEGEKDIKVSINKIAFSKD